MFIDIDKAIIHIDVDTWMPTKGHNSTYPKQAGPHKGEPWGWCEPIIAILNDKGLDNMREIPDSIYEMEAEQMVETQVPLSKLIDFWNMGHGYETKLA